MTSSQKKYVRILEKFKHSQIHSLFHGVFEYCKALPVIEHGIDVTSLGEDC